MQKMNVVSQQAQKGFTLIELVVVIVILGILAATALPKFADMGKDARSASAKAAAGSLASVAAMVHSKWLVGNNSAAATVLLETTSITTSATGWPQLDAATFAAAGITSADYDLSNVTAGYASVKGAATAATCAAHIDANGVASATVTGC